MAWLIVCVAGVGGFAVEQSPRTHAPGASRPNDAQQQPGEKKAEPADGLLTIDRIFGSGEFAGEQAGLWRWSRQGDALWWWRPSPNDGRQRQLVRIELATGDERVLATSSDLVPEGKRQPLKVEGFQLSSDESKLLIFTNSRRVWRYRTRGDYWLLDLQSKRLSKLGGDIPPATMMFAKFSPDGSRVAYVHKNNIYVQRLDDLQVSPVTTDGSDTLINGTSDWVNEEELSIRDAFRWSPDGRAIAFWQFDTSGVKRMHLIDNTSGKYPRVISFPYPKVGEQNSATRIGVVWLERSEIVWLKVPGDPRNHYIPHVEWLPDGRRVALQQLDRLQQTCRVMLADPETGRTSTVLTETDEAWLENENPFRWLAGGREFLWLSERSGWRHAYRAATDGSSLEPITGGSLDVIDVEGIDEEGGWLYFAASPDNATQRYLYRVSLQGGKPQRITPTNQPGWHTYDVSPNGRWAIHTCSTFTQPPATELVRLPQHEPVLVLASNQSLRERVARLRQPQCEFLRVAISEGVELDGWCIRPPDFDPQRKYPLLVFVYGEPHGQTVRDAWPGQRGLWHWMLAQQGMVVASFDNRGTRVPRGRQWRKCVYRQIGLLAADDQAAAVRRLLEQCPHIDPQRIAVWGWSGGGSMSLNAIFRFPDLYSTAIAVAPNPCQWLYDTIYQERYMGLPDDNWDNYRAGSPITHAKGLRGNLLIIHGTADDNVHYQTTELLINELVAHGKQFTVMPYPGRTHALSEGRNTPRHMYTMMTRFLVEHLRPGQPSAPASGRVTERSWIIRRIHGWRVHIDRRLLQEQADQTERALQLLANQLAEIERVVPPQAVAKLRQVSLWFSPQYPGVRPRAEYHPNERWLREHGRDPVMVKGVEFTNVSIFEAETRRMPNFALHELAHAYHDQVLGFDHPEVKAAYERAKASGSYDRVLRQDSEGRRRYDRAYAMTNEREYFAECTEAFFSKNDFFPFDRQELEAHDPVMFRLLHRLWGVTAQNERAGGAAADVKAPAAEPASPTNKEPQR